MTFRRDEGSNRSNISNNESAVFLGGRANPFRNRFTGSSLKRHNGLSPDIYIYQPAFLIWLTADDRRQRFHRFYHVLTGFVDWGLR
jgi:hypothetical protein